MQNVTVLDLMILAHAVPMAQERYSGRLNNNFTIYIIFIQF